MEARQQFESAARTQGEPSAEDGSAHSSQEHVVPRPQVVTSTTESGASDSSGSRGAEPASSAQRLLPIYRPGVPHGGQTIPTQPGAQVSVNASRLQSAQSAIKGFASQEGLQSPGTAVALSIDDAPSTFPGGQGTAEHGATANRAVEEATVLPVESASQLGVSSFPVDPHRHTQKPTVAFAGSDSTAGTLTSSSWSSPHDHRPHDYAANTLSLRFKDPYTEAAYLEDLFDRCFWSTVAIVFLFAAATFYQPLAASVLRAPATVIALYWVAWACRILVLLWTALAYQKRSLIVWWGSLSALLYAASVCSSLLAIWICNADSGGIQGLSGCPAYSGSHAPFFPFAVVTLIPWVMVFVMGIDLLWVVVTGAMCVSLSAVAMFVNIGLFKGASDSYAAPAMAYIAVSWFAALLAGWLQNATDRRGFVSSNRLSQALAVTQAQIRARQRAEERAVKLQGAMDAAGHVVTDMTVRYMAQLHAEASCGTGAHGTSVSGTDALLASLQRLSVPATRWDNEPQLQDSVEFVIQYASAAAKTLYGRDPTELRGKNMLDTVHEEDVQPVLSSFASACRRAESSSEQVPTVPWIVRFRRVRPAQEREGSSARRAAPESTRSGHGSAGTTVTQGNTKGSLRPHHPTVADIELNSVRSKASTPFNPAREILWVEMVAHITFVRSSTSLADAEAGGSVRAVSVLGTERDVTGEVTAREAMEREREGKAAASAAIDASQRSLAYAAHELRGPLHSIGASLELLAEHTLTLPSDARRDFQAVTEGAATLRHLVDDILDASKLRNGGLLAVHLAPVDVRQLLADVCRQHESFASVPLLWEVTPLLGRLVETDGTRLRQCLTNAITNAAKHTFEGCISIRCRVVQLTESSSSPSASTDSTSSKSSTSARHRPRYMLELQVIDTGTGLNGAEPESLFAEYAQGKDEALVSKARGTGLGLPIVRKLATLLHGQCTLAEQETTVPKIFNRATIKTMHGIRELVCPAALPPGSSSRSAPEDETSYGGMANGQASGLGLRPAPTSMLAGSRRRRTERRSAAAYGQGPSRPATADAAQLGTFRGADVSAPERQESSGNIAAASDLSASLQSGGLDSSNPAVSGAPAGAPVFVPPTFAARSSFSLSGVPPMQAPTIRTAADTPPPGAQTLLSTATSITGEPGPRRAALGRGGLEALLAGGRASSTPGGLGGESSPAQPGEAESPALVAAVLGMTPGSYPIGPYQLTSEGYSTVVLRTGSRAEGLASLILPPDMMRRKCTVFTLAVPVAELEAPPQIPTPSLAEVDRGTEVSAQLPGESVGHMDVAGSRSALLGSSRSGSQSSPSAARGISSPSVPLSRNPFVRYALSIVAGDGVSSTHAGTSAQAPTGTGASLLPPKTPRRLPMSPLASLASRSRTLDLERAFPVVDASPDVRYRAGQVATEGHGGLAAEAKGRSQALGVAVTSPRRVVQPLRAVTLPASNHAEHAPLRRALLVDDDASNRRLTGRLLRRIGLETCDVAGDGVEALEIILTLANAPPEILALASSSVLPSPGRMSEAAQVWLTTARWPYDVLLLDVGLPRKTGDVVATQLRALGCVLPILSVTGSANPEEVARLKAAGFDHVLGKPFTSSDLQEALVQVRAAAGSRTRPQATQQEDTGQQPV